MLKWEGLKMIASMHENQTSILDLPLDVFLLLYENNDKIETANACAGCFWRNGLCDDCCLAADGLTIDDKGKYIFSVCTMYKPEHEGYKEYKRQHQERS
jgi:hypothetical protein